MSDEELHDSESPQPNHKNVATDEAYDYSALCTPLWDEIPGNPTVSAPWNLHFHRSVRGAGVVARLLAKSSQLREETKTFTDPEGKPLDDQTEQDLHLVMLQLLRTIEGYADILWGEALRVGGQSRESILDEPA